MTRILLLLGVWLALFRELSPGLVLGGLAVAWLANRVVPSPRVPAVRWWRLPRLLLDETSAIVRSTLAVARTVVTRGPAPSPAALALRLAGADLRELSWVAAAMTLTPGTYVIDVDPDRELLRLHLLDGSRAAETADDVRRIHRDVRGVLRTTDESTIEMEFERQPVQVLADRGDAP